VAIDFARVWSSTPGMSLLLTAGPEYRIVAVSDDYVATVGIARDALVGRPVLDAFAGPHATHVLTMANLRASLDRVVATRQRDVMDMQRYDLATGDGFAERHWRPVNAPVVDDDGRLAFIVHRVEDATAQVRARRAETEERAARDAARESLQAEVRTLRLREENGFLPDLDAITAICRFWHMDEIGYHRL